jgi:electron transfer flavoprotein alpha subunit
MGNDILVFAEHFQGTLNDITYELLGKGRELAQSLGSKLVVGLLGHEVGGFVEKLGAADQVCLVDRPELKEFASDNAKAILEAFIEDVQPRLVLLGSTSIGLELLGLISARKGLPCLDSCTRLESREGQLVATCQIYGGKVSAEVALPDATTLIAVVPGSFPRELGEVAGKPELRSLALPPAPVEVRMTFRMLLVPPPGDVDITKAPILVAVGRGIQNADNMPLAEELADALGGAVCASRPVIDQGWLPLTRQVGKSGMTVKPKLYLALGISGAPEHLEGMKQSELIVAVNTDPNAPIFGVAHYGAVVDAVELLPLLTEEIGNQAQKKAS